MLTLLVVSMVIFGIFQIIPGDAVLSRLGLDADPDLVEAMRQEMRLNDPPLQRYFSWLVGLIRGDLGNSLRYSVPVSSLIAMRLPVTFTLAALSFCQVLIISIPLGLWLAEHNHTTKGRLISALVQVLLAIPVFAMAIVLMLVFGLWLGLFPISAAASWEQGWLSFLSSLILPSFALSLPSIAITVRYLKSSLQEQSEKDYVRTARSKGLDQPTIFKKHLLRNALLPVITILGVILINTLGGSIVIESAFSVPGIGQLLGTAIRSRDLPLVQGISFYIATIIVLGFLLLDEIYRLVDPRLRGNGGDLS